MQHFNRQSIAAPEILLSESAKRARREMCDFMQSSSDRRSQTSSPQSDFYPDDESMRDALERLFRGRCAFCEAREQIYPYRFRPPAEALPPSSASDGHLYYVWLAHAWENFYAICNACRPSESNFFPVSGKRCALPTAEELDRYVDDNQGLWRNHPPKEQITLLDPCYDETFDRSLHPCLDGQLAATSKRGKASIDLFNLNRQELAHRRRDAYRTHLDQLMNDSPVSSKSALGATELFRFEEMEFGGTWFLLLRRLARRMGTGAQRKTAHLSRARIGQFFSPIKRSEAMRGDLERALEHLADEDATAITPNDAYQSPRRPSAARLREVRFENFKTIERLTITLPQQIQSEAILAPDRPVPSLLIIGENATGKSSILEGITLALAPRSVRTRYDQRANEFILNPTYLGSPLDHKDRSARVDIQLTDGEPLSLTIRPGSMGAGGDPPEAIPVFAYGAFRHYQVASGSAVKDRYTRNLFDGGVLPNPEKWLLKLDKDKFSMVTRALRKILAVAGEFDVIEPAPDEGRCYVITNMAADDPGAGRNRTPLSAVSSGFRSVLAMACEIMHGLMDPRVYPGFETLTTSRGVILIDEVEAHLHPRWKMQVMRGLREALPQMTFIATTHDPLCLRGMEDGEVVVLQKVANRQSRNGSDLSTTVEVITDLPPISKLRIDQLLTSDFFQLYSTDAPEMDRSLAHVGDLMTKRSAGLPLTPPEEDVIRKFELDVALALPIGTSEVQRLIQEAVAEYLKERRGATEERMKALRVQTKQSIIKALKGH